MELKNGVKTFYTNRVMYGANGWRKTMKKKHPYGLLCTRKVQMYQAYITPKQ